MSDHGKFGGRSDYFAVNDKAFGVSTSYRVSGRLGEFARRFSLFRDANEYCKALNRAYRLGCRHGADVAVHGTDQKADA